MSKELKQCVLCEAKYTVCKFNHSRQKYCKRDTCCRQRKKLSNERFLRKNSDYFKERYRMSKVSIPNAPEPESSDSNLRKRVLANESRLDNQSQVVENQLILLVGLMVKLSGSLAQAPAFWLRDFLAKCYEEGTHLLKGESEFNNKNLMEIFHELSAQYLESRPRAPNP